MIITQILLYLIIGYAAYMLVLVASGLFYRTQATQLTGSLPTIKVFLPAYRPEPVFNQVMQQLKVAKKDYPVEVFILFQHADFGYIELADQLGFDYEVRSFDHHGGNSYQHVLRYLSEQHLNDQPDYVMVLDKDNLIAPDFFDTLQEIGLAGWHVIQGVRRPLETSNSLQVFDALSERLNDLMLRAGKCFWGGTLELSGSAALIETTIFRQCIAALDPKAPGFDKNFMVNLLTHEGSLKTRFSEELVVFEEKTSQKANYDSQRLRWFGEQYYNAFFKARQLWSGLAKGHFRCLDYWISLSRPPRIVLFAVSSLLAAIDLWDGEPGILSIAFVMNYLTMLMVAFPYLDQIRPTELVRSSWQVLRSNIVASVFSLRKKNLGTFIHTR